MFLLAHLFRELKKVDDKKDSGEWSIFAKKLKRLLNDAVRLCKRKDLTREKYICLKSRINERIHKLLVKKWEDSDVIRLCKRLNKYRDSLFTFLEQPDVPYNNNHAEREIRPAVIIRKNSLCNRSQNGANTQAIMMSVYRTLKLRNLDPLETIVNALKKFVNTGVLPQIPDAKYSDN